MTADPRRPLTQYTSSRNIADLVLTATYSRDMFRSAVHDPGRLALVLGYALLAELVATDRIRIAGDGLVHHRGAVPGPDLAVEAILADLHREPIPSPHPGRPQRTLLPR
jgi:hypothetical protein